MLLFSLYLTIIYLIYFEKQTSDCDVIRWFFPIMNISFSLWRLKNANNPPDFLILLYVIFHLVFILTFLHSNGIIKIIMHFS